MYSFIIRRDGSFVVRNTDEENYFDRLWEKLAEEGSTAAAEEYVKDLQHALNENLIHSNIMETDNGHVYMLCMGLPPLEWYLMSVIPAAASGAGEGKAGGG